MPALFRTGDTGGRVLKRRTVLTQTTNGEGPTIRAVGRAFPEHYVDQATLSAALRGLWVERHFNVDRLDDLHRAVKVEGRYLALPVDAYPGLDTFAKKNEAWGKVAVELGATAVTDALGRAGLVARDIDHIVSVTVTGVATPSLDARLVTRLGFRDDIKRTPIFGLGCVAGAAGVARASDYLRAFPGENALLLSVELCSLTLQREDVSIPNMIAAGLFGDGAAAVVLSGGAAREVRGPRVVATRSVFYPDTERTMGWDMVDGGFKVVLSPRVPALVREHLRGDVDRFLAAQGLSRGDVRHWVAHTGGPKVLEAFEEALELPTGALERSWRSLREVGNISSASVLLVLASLLEDGAARPGDYGLMMAMGPGFCSELVLLRW